MMMIATMLQAVAKYTESGITWVLREGSVCGKIARANTPSPLPHTSTVLCYDTPLPGSYPRQDQKGEKQASAKLIHTTLGIQEAQREREQGTLTRDLTHLKQDVLSRVSLCVVSSNLNQRIIALFTDPECRA